MDFDHRLEFWINRKHNVSETESVSSFRLGKETVLGPLQRSNLNHFSITHHRHKPLHWSCKIRSGIDLSAVLIHYAEECPSDWQMII
jgi:hypothetical protein